MTDVCSLTEMVIFIFKLKAYHVKSKAILKISNFFLWLSVLLMVETRENKLHHKALLSMSCHKGQELNCIQLRFYLNCQISLTRSILVIYGH